MLSSTKGKFISLKKYQTTAWTSVLKVFSELMTPDSVWSTVNIHSPVQTQFFIRSHFINQAVHNKNNTKLIDSSLLSCLGILQITVCPSLRHHLAALFPLLTLSVQSSTPIACHLLTWSLGPEVSLLDIWPIVSIEHRVWVTWKQKMSFDGLCQTWWIKGCAKVYYNLNDDYFNRAKLLHGWGFFWTPVWVRE